MDTYRFTVYLTGIQEVTDEPADALFAAGCDDGTFGSRDGQAIVHFDRRAGSLEEAIRSAIGDVAKTGYGVRRVASSKFETIARLNQELAAP